MPLCLTCDLLHLKKVRHTADRFWLLAPLLQCWANSHVLPLHFLLGSAYTGIKSSVHLEIASRKQFCQLSYSLSSLFISYLSGPKSLPQVDRHTVYSIITNFMRTREEGKRQGSLGNLKSEHVLSPQYQDSFQPGGIYKSQHSERNDKGKLGVYSLPTKVKEWQLFKFLPL